MDAMISGVITSVFEIAVLATHLDRDAILSMLKQLQMLIDDVVGLTRHEV